MIDYLDWTLDMRSARGLDRDRSDGRLARLVDHFGIIRTNKVDDDHDDDHHGNYDDDDDDDDEMKETKRDYA